MDEKVTSIGQQSASAPQLTRQSTLRPAEEVQNFTISQQQPKAQAAFQSATQPNAEVICPKCGTPNSADAMFCSSCGAQLQVGQCPFCGSPIDPDADFCEVCHKYVREEICSFCGADFPASESFCPQCGAPKGGIVCPKCHTLNDFAFCKQCGEPLTVYATQLVEQLRQQDDYQLMVQLAHEYSELAMELPYASDRDKLRMDECDKLRERVLKLLANDAGVESTPQTTPEPHPQRMSKEELDKKKEEKLAQLTAILEQMAIPPLPKPAVARNYAMAQKPAGMRLAWVCNYQHAIHSSPCGCAKPHMGGKWIVLGHGAKQEFKDDTK